MTHGYLLNEDKEPVLKRLRRVEGQVRGLQRMVDEERYCIDVLTQVSAATAGLGGSQWCWSRITSATASEAGARSGSTS